MSDGRTTITFHIKSQVLCDFLSKDETARKYVEDDLYEQAYIEDNDEVDLNVKLIKNLDDLFDLLLTKEADKANGILFQTYTLGAEPFTEAGANRVAQALIEIHEHKQAIIDSIESVLLSLTSVTFDEGDDFGTHLYGIFQQAESNESLEVTNAIEKPSAYNVQMSYAYVYGSESYSQEGRFIVNGKRKKFYFDSD